MKWLDSLKGTQQANSIHYKTCPEFNSHHHHFISEQFHFDSVQERQRIGNVLPYNEAPIFIRKGARAVSVNITVAHCFTPSLHIPSRDVHRLWTHTYVLPEREKQKARLKLVLTLTNRNAAFSPSAFELFCQNLSSKLNYLHAPFSAP